MSSVAPLSVTSPSAAFEVDRSELVRLLTQTLFDLGYKEAGHALEKESGVVFESPEVKDFRNAVMGGNWDKAKELLLSLPMKTPETYKEACLYIESQRFMELLEAGKSAEALGCLRGSIAGGGATPKQLHRLSSMLMCGSKEALYAKAEWEGAGDVSRARVLSQCQGCFSAAQLLPARRLPTLIAQAIEFQHDRCLYHNPRNVHVSLYADHCCDRNQIPRRAVHVLDGHRDEVWHLRFSHSGRYLASASKDTTVLVWDVFPGEGKVPPVVARLAEHTEPLSFLAWSPDDTMILTCGNDCVLRLWNVKTGRCMLSVTRHTDAVTACAWLPDSRSFISGGLDKHLYQWDLAGNELRSWEGPRASDLAVSADGGRLVVVSAELIKMYDLITGEEDSMQESDSITSLWLSRDGNFLLVNLFSSELHVWDLNARALVRKYRGQKQGRFVIRACFGGANESFVVSGSEDSQVYIWHRHHEVLLDALPGHTATVNAVAWNPADPHMIASCSDDHTVRIWGLEDPTAAPPAAPPPPTAPDREAAAPAAAASAAPPANGAVSNANPPSEDSGGESGSTGSSGSS